MRPSTGRLLLDPFVLAAICFTIPGMFILRRPADAWAWALTGLTLMSFAAPLTSAFEPRWLQAIFRANLAVLSCWALLLLLARLAAPLSAAPDGSALLAPARLYVFLVPLSGMLHFFKRFFRRRPVGPGNPPSRPSS